MRSKAFLAAVIVGLVHLAAPQPAEAIFGSGWLERLSGPGPFLGLTLDHRIACLTRPDVSRSAARDSFERHQDASKFVAPSEPGRRFYATLAGCNFLDRDQPRVDLGLQAAFFWSKKNLLDYSERPSNLDTDINVRMLLVTADIRINRLLDVGAGIGKARFSPDRGELFPSFGRTVTQPMRLTTRPLAAFTEEAIWELATVRFDATKLHGTFTAEDFGAKPGTYSEAGELIWSWAVVVDLGPIIWR